VGGVIAQESLPAIRARAVTPWHELGDAGDVHRGWPLWIQTQLHL